jgi:hypothetical protein
VNLDRLNDCHYIKIGRSSIALTFHRDEEERERRPDGRDWRVRASVRRKDGETFTAMLARALALLEERIANGMPLDQRHIHARACAICKLKAPKTTGIRKVAGAQVWTCGPCRQAPTGSVQ